MNLPPDTNRWRDAALPFLMGLAVVILYAPILSHDFINLDDPVFITQNPHIRGGLTVDTVIWALTTNSYEGNWIPLTWIAHATLVSLFGYDPAAHHGASLVLHAANSLLVFVLAVKLGGRRVEAAFVSLLFGVHPLHVESVAWGAELKDVLSAFFFISSLIFHLSYRRDGRTGHRVGSVVTGIAAMASKSMAVSLPLVILILDTFVTPGKGEKKAFWRCLVESAPLWMMAALTSHLTYQGHRAAAAIADDLGVGERLVRGAVSYVSYILKMAWPADLAVFYPFDPTPPSPGIVVVSVSLLLAVTFAAVRWRGSFPVLPAGWLWFLVTLLPVIGLIRIGDHSIANRYTYLPSIGIFWITAWGVTRLERFMPKAVCLVAMGAVLGILSWRTAQELPYWRGSEPLMLRAMEVTEGNWVAMNNLGMEYLRQGRVDEAIRMFEESVRVQPDYPVSLVNLAAMKGLRGEREEALLLVRRALSLQPDHQRGREVLQALGGE